MDENFYGLSASPFQLTPDARFFYESTVHRKAMAYLVYGLHNAEGFIIIIGEVGAGKTILADNLLSTIDQSNFVISSRPAATDDGVRDRPAVLVGDPALHDDALAKRRLPIHDRQIGHRRKMRGIEARASGLGDCVWQPHQGFLRVALVGAAIGGGVIGRLGLWLIGPKRDRILRALSHSCSPSLC
jgi:hypothetical protein